MTAIQNRMKELVAIKERQDGRRYTHEDIAAITGVSRGSITTYMNNRAGRFDEAVLLRICSWLDCTIGDLLVIVSDESPEKNSLRRPARRLQQTA